MPDSDLVTLAGGLTLPREAIDLAIDLELRGLRLLADGDGLAVRPRDLLTDADVTAIRRWKRHLLALLAYEPPAPAWIQ